jgi:GAF domain-containing protein/HAMP domain-containing protein
MPGSGSHKAPETRNVKPKTPIRPRVSPARFDLAELQRTYRWLLALLFAFVLAMVVFYLWIFETTGSRHALYNAALVAGTFTVASAAYLLVRLGKPNAAGIWLLTGLALSYGFNEFSFKGLLPSHLVGGVLLIFLVGNVVLPRKWSVWVILSAAYAGGLLLINQFSPLLRYDAASSSFITTFSIGSNILLGLVFVLQLIWFTQRLTIRKRLVFAFVLVVLIPTFASTALTMLLFRSNTEQQVFEKLEAVAYLKEAEIRSWKQSLEPNLFLAKNRLGPAEQVEMIGILTQGSAAAASPDFQQTYNQVKRQFDEAIVQSRVFETIFIMDLEGDILLSTNKSQEGRSHFGRDYYNQGLERTFITPPSRSLDTGMTTIVVVTPYQDQGGKTIAILGAQVSLKRLDVLMAERAGLGETGETYLVSPRKILMSPSRYSGYLPQEASLTSLAVEVAAVQRIHGRGLYSNYRGIEAIGVFRWLPELQLGLVAEQDLSEAFRPLNSLIYANLAASAVAVLMAVAAGFLVTRRIITPLDKLGKTAEMIAAGNLSLVAEVEQRDEIGVLASSFNSMTSQLRYLIGSLEQRVADRTMKLERRSVQLRVAAEIARDASSMHNLNELLTIAVNLIRDRFGFYHAGIFLLDEKGEYAMLTAATGEAGRKMLDAGHSLKVGEVGLVGHVTATGQPRIALDVGSDSAHFKNPLLPNTRSEAVLPLVVGSKITGALDVQSVEANAFDAETVEVLQTMTDQLAVAIENARLIRHMERAVRELEAAYGKYTTESWREFYEKTQRKLSYRYRGLGVEAVEDPAPEGALPDAEEQTLAAPSAENPLETGVRHTGIAIPMRLRGQVVGTVNLRVRGEQVAGEAAATYEEMVNRLTMNLENVRLLEEAQLRSEQLRLLQEITAAAAAYVDLNALMTILSQKIQEGFNLSRCAVFLLTPDKCRLTAIADHTDSGQAGSQSPVSAADISLPLDNSPVLQQVIVSQQPAVFYADRDPETISALEETFQSNGTAGVILVPVLTRGEAMGLLLLETNDPARRFVQDDLRLVEQIRLQMSAALDVARLFEQTEQRAERERLISEITTRIRESLEVDTILKTAARELRRSLDLEMVELRLGDTLFLPAGRNGFQSEIDPNLSPASEHKQIEASLQELRAMSGEGWKSFSHTPVEIGYLCNDTDTVMPAFGPVSMEVMSAGLTRKKAFGPNASLAVPIRIRSQEAGIARFQKRDGSGSWQDEEVQLLEALTDQLGMALESARLYEDTQRRAERERLISEVTSKLRATTHLDTILQTAVQELAEALHVHQGTIVLRHEGESDANE